MTAAQMVTAGLAAYGVNWEHELATRTGMTSAKIHRYTLGVVPMPVKVTTQQKIAKKLKTTW